ncbi:MAG: ATP synthase F1 subunit delta [Candidatus Limnocylindria bacterium]
MARRQTAARRYAEAAFQVAREDRSQDRWASDLAALEQALADDRLRALVEHPAVSFADKERVLRGLVGKRVAPAALNLVLLMVRRGRAGAFGPMLEHFRELMRRERGIARAEVRTALPLDDDGRAAIVERVKALTGREAELEEVVDESLIGGVTVRIGDRLYDASVRRRLERLRSRILAA